MQGGWHCHFLVSDGAKALIKLALEGLDCASVPDLFHALRSLGQPLGSAIGRQLSQLRKQHSQRSEQLAKTTEQTNSAELQKELEQLAVQQQGLESAQRRYHLCLHAITQAIHPFNLTTGDWQLGQELKLSLCSPLERLRSLAQCYGNQKAPNAIDTFERQIPSFAFGIHAWWRWVSQALNAKTDDLQMQQWVRFEPVTLDLLAPTSRQNPTQRTQTGLSGGCLPSLRPLEKTPSHSTIRDRIDV